MKTLPVSGLLVGESVTVKVGKTATIECIASGERDCEGETCGERILWTTTPNGKPMPVDLPLPVGEPATPHWATCVDRERFRR